MKPLLILTFAASSALAAVKSEDITLRDEKRGKDIECRVHFPDTGDKLPLIVFSHGFGGDKTAFATISQHVAEHGYVIVHPSHADGMGHGGLRRGAAELPAQQQRPGETEDTKTGARRFHGLLGAGGGLVGMLNDPSKIEGRVADVVAVMDSIEQLCTVNGG